MQKIHRMNSLLASLRRISALASGAFVLGTTSLPAAVITWDVPDVTALEGAGFDASGVWFNFFTGEATYQPTPSGFLPLALGQFQINFNGGNGYVNLVNKTPFFDAAQWVNVGNGVARLAEGDVVDGFSFFTDDFTILASVTTDFYNSFDDLGTGYIGVNFTDADVNTYYGYAQVTVNPDFTVTLNSFAYESVPGAGITIPTAIPEPASAAALAGGALLAVAALRRRRV